MEKDMSVARTVAFLVMVTNQILAMLGWSPLPFDSEKAVFIVSGALTIITGLIAWWKNNYLSPRGKRQKEVLQNHTYGGKKLG